MRSHKGDREKRSGFLKRRRNNLDERQESRLQKLEARCFWGIYVFLVVVLLAERALGFTVRETAGELAAVILASLLAIGGSIYQGIWDRYLSADAGTNFRVSLVAAIASGVLCTVMLAVRFQQNGIPLSRLWLVFSISFFITFGACMAALTVCTFLYKKRIAKLEAQADEEEVTEEDQEAETEEDQRADEEKQAEEKEQINKEQQNDGKG